MLKLVTIKDFSLTRHSIITSHRFGIFRAVIILFFYEVAF